LQLNPTGQLHSPSWNRRADPALAEKRAVVV
jgi:hypothetical protein